MITESGFLLKFHEVDNSVIIVRQYCPRKRDIIATENVDSGPIRIGACSHPQECIDTHNTLFILGGDYNRDNSYFRFKKSTANIRKFCESLLWSGQEVIVDDGLVHRKYTRILL